MQHFNVSRIPWSDQLLSRLGTQDSDAILPLEAIALRHPYDLVYSFKVSEEARASNGVTLTQVTRGF